MKKIAGFRDLGVHEDGEYVQFQFFFDNGREEAYECTHGIMVELVSSLFTCQLNCSNARDKAGKTYVPMPQPGVVREFNLSKFGVLPGQDGVPRMVFTLNNGSTHLVRLTANDAKRWIEMLGEVVTAAGESDAVR